MARIYGRHQRRSVKAIVSNPCQILPIEQKAIAGPTIATINILSKRVEEALVQFRQAINDLEVIKFDLDLFYAEAISTNKK